MARIWANCLESRAKKWSEVPEFRRADVRAVLAGDVRTGRITAEQYREITGEAYKREAKRK